MNIIQIVLSALFIAYALPIRLACFLIIGLVIVCIIQNTKIKTHE